MSEAMNFEGSASDGLAELWHVQLHDGEVKLWSLDQLDAAFQADLIDERTHVLRDGTMEWLKLGELLGLDAAPEAPPVEASVTPGPVSVSPASISPVSIPAPVSVAPPSAVAYSVRPPADLPDDLDFDAMAMRPNKKRGLMIGLAAAALLVVGIGVAVNAGSTSGPAASEVAAAAAAALPPVVATPAATPVPPPAADPAPANPQAAAGTDRFSDSQRKALLDADKARDAARKARAAAAAPARSPRISSKPVFHKGGNKYDPLNSQL